jgi:selenoprotein W-related protein|tara:strand:- start:955 stop:1119 length:165 start_codon:yes stop_codon:yes gene_type:complete
LAAKLKSEFALEVELVKAGGGVFEVMHDNVLIYSKKQTGTFPDEDQLIIQIKNR